MPQSSKTQPVTVGSGVITLQGFEHHTAEVFTGIHQVPVHVWEQCLRPHELFLSLKYLEAAEKSRLPGMQFRYALIRRGNTPVSILYFQLVNLSDTGLGGILNLSDYGGLAGSLSTRINDILFNPGRNRESMILVCGNLLVSGNHGIGYVNDEELRVAVSAITPLKKIISGSLPAHARIVAYMVKDFYSHAGSLVSPILKKDYFLLNTDPEMILHINREWKTFDDYKAALSSKYRVRANNVLARLAGIEIRELDLQQIEQREQELFKLNDAVIMKAPVKLARPSPAYFINLKRMFGTRYRIHGFFSGDTLIAFTSGLWSETHYEAHFIGLDYAYNRAYSLYQNILYFYIRDAITCGSGNLYFGRTALEIKSTVGARPHPLSCYFRFANKVLNTLAKPLVSSTGPGDWTPRDPFKNES